VPSLQTAKVRLDGALSTAGAVAVPVHCREWHQAAFGGPFRLKPSYDSIIPLHRHLKMQNETCSEVPCTPPHLQTSHLWTDVLGSHKAGSSPVGATGDSYPNSSSWPLKTRMCSTLYINLLITKLISISVTAHSESISKSCQSCLATFVRRFLLDHVSNHRRWNSYYLNKLNIKATAAGLGSGGDFLPSRCAHPGRDAAGAPQLLPSMLGAGSCSSPGDNETPAQHPSFEQCEQIARAWRQPRSGWTGL